jgi:hypothetical protein
LQRIPCDERSDWRDKADQAGFAFHTIDGARYWDERAYYAFTLKEVEDDLEAPTAELDAMCRELVARAVDDERMLDLLRIPQRFWTFIAASWKRGDPSLYGRFDLSYDGRGPAKLLEYNADTPTSVFETAVFQWQWLEDAKARAITPNDADQYNSLHEQLIAGWREIGKGAHLHLAGALDSAEDAGTIAYLEDTARQAGLTTTALAMDAIGRTPKGAFVDASDKPISLMFKLYPWEWMFREQFGTSLGGSPTRWSSRRGRRSCPTRAFCRCCGRCSRATRICCRPGSRTIRSRRNSATRMSANRFTRARAPMWRSWSAARRSIRTQVLMAKRGSCARRWRPCRGLTAITPLLGPGSRPASLAGSRSARI